MGADNLSIVDNNVQNAAAYSPWGESGINVYHGQDTQGEVGTTGVCVMENYVSGTQQLVDSQAIGQNTITDGNGIVLDADNWNGYDQVMLVEGNAVTGNDRGIKVGNTNNAKVIGNTASSNNNANDSFGLDNIALISSTGETVTGNTTDDGTQILNAQTGFQTYNANSSA